MSTALLVVLDAVGLPTVDYLLDHFNGAVQLPHLSALGIGNLVSSRHRARFARADGTAYAAPLEQASASADSVIWSNTPGVNLTSQSGFTYPFYLYNPNVSVAYNAHVEQLDASGATIMNIACGGSVPKGT